ncbi:MAG: hypothetical protein CVU24_15655 [Betaproteobacteria bacterium HGW-Betaproteobacteria-18]|nr:MAG: hypothetical protein CVU24_15655 [Betaproteobacteria bacterium HGW-Betaproteobacteria-18]
MSDHFYFTPPRVLHVPLRPPRKATPGEGIYLQLWKEFAESRPKEWHAIFQTNGPVRQRAASVAASFMAYMGCGGGRDFTFKAEAAAAQESAFGSREAAFLATWAVFNRRQRGINRGLRSSEFMLASAYPVSSSTARSVDWDLVPNVSQEDNDILESMVCWWSSTHAGVIREIAEPMRKAEETKQFCRLFEREPQT